METTAGTLETGAGRRALRFRWGDGARALAAALALAYASRLPGSEAAIIPAVLILGYALLSPLPVWRLAMLPRVRRAVVAPAGWLAALAGVAFALAPVVNSGIEAVAFTGNVLFAALVCACAAVCLRAALRWSRGAFGWARAWAPGHAESARCYLRLATGL